MKKKGKVPKKFKYKTVLVYSLFLILDVSAIGYFSFSKQTVGENPVAIAEKTTKLIYPAQYSDRHITSVL